jgi:putative ABC transport system substrate-binding protein
MNRRELVALLGALGLGWYRPARAQQTMPVIGFLHSGAPGPNANRLTGFRTGLREGGFVEGQNVAIEFRWAEDRNDRLPELAADLVRRRVNVITALSATQAAPRRPALKPFQLFSRLAPIRSRSAWSPA